MNKTLWRDDLIKRQTIFAILLIAAMIFGFTSGAYASSPNPYGTEVTSKYVKATAKCSCGHGTYTYKTAVFENYCPQCHSYGTLVRSWKKPEYEGQWTCKKCDCDYCMQDGREKMPRTSLWLRKYVNTSTKGINSTNETIKVEVIGKKHQNQNTWQNFIRKNIGINTTVNGIINTNGLNTGLRFNSFLIT